MKVLSAKNNRIKLLKYKLSTHDKPLIMGILNCTPDSFYDGGKYLDHHSALTHARKLISDGADIIDVGGESSRPGAMPIAPHDEISRIKPVVKDLRKEFSDVLISVDTYKADVACEMLKEGADIINDISGLRDKGMLKVIQEYQSGLIIMHMKNDPQTMQDEPAYGNVVDEVYQFLFKRFTVAKEAGIDKDQIIIDPGIGFGKTLEHNICIIQALSRFKEISAPVLIGISNKSMLGQLTGRPKEDRLVSSLASSLAAISNGADIIRVHDVCQHQEFLNVYNSLKNKLRKKNAI